MPDTALTGLASDFRRQLIIDRYSSVLSRLPLRRQTSLAEQGGRDAEIWNVFRTLAQIDPSLWLTRLLATGRLRLPLVPEDLAAGVGLTLWKRIKPPPERLHWLHQRALRGQLRPLVGRRRKGRVVPLSELQADLRERARRRLPLEDPVEVDVIVKSQGWVLLVEVPDPRESPGEPAASDRDRSYLLRLIDAGLSYAEARSRLRKHPIGFALLILAPSVDVEATWSRALRGLADTAPRLLRRLPHRDPAVDLSPFFRGLGIGNWSAMGPLLSALRREVSDELETVLLDRLLRHRKSAGSSAAS